MSTSSVARTIFPDVPPAYLSLYAVIGAQWIPARQPDFGRAWRTGMPEIHVGRRDSTDLSLGEIHEWVEPMIGTEHVTLLRKVVALVK